VKETDGLRVVEGKADEKPLSCKRVFVKISRRVKRRNWKEF
jgi:hypothetical protein